MSKRIIKIFTIILLTCFIFGCKKTPLEEAETGWFYYSDGSCSEFYNSSKSVIGVVLLHFDEVLVIKNGWELIWEPTWYAAKNYKKTILVGNEEKTWHIMNMLQADQAWWEKDKLNISLQTLRDNHVEGTNTLHGKFWLTDDAFLDDGYIIDFDSPTCDNNLLLGNKNQEINMWAIMSLGYKPD